MSAVGAQLAELAKQVAGLSAAFDKAFDPNQPRDKDGKWTDSGGGGSAAGDIASQDALPEYDGEGPPKSHMDDRPGVRTYAGTSGAYYVNRTLREGTEHQLDSITAGGISRLDSSIASSPPLEEMDVYRGVSGEFISQLESGRVLTDAAFMSASRSEWIARLHARGHNSSLGSPAIMRIKIPSGTRALIVRGSSEREVIFPRGGRLKITRTPGPRQMPINAEDYGRGFEAEYLPPSR